MASYEPLASQIQECYDEEQGAHSTSLGTHRNNGNSSFIQATFNSVNLLLGIGILSSPYNLQEGGLLGLGILFLCGAMFCYTAYTLGLCVSRDRKISTYQEIAELAFGRRCRIVISLLLYLELLGVLVGFTISLGDNLVKLFPGVELHLGWIRVAPEHFLPLVAVFVVLPTVWVRDLSWLSYVSMGGVASYLVIVVAVTCAGVFNDIGFHYSVPLVNFGNLATVTGLSAYCYSAHVVFPSIYSSIKNPSQYPRVLVVSFLIATLIYTGFAFVGATMFGDEIQSQVTLNLPSYLVVAKICLWVVVLIPLTKYSIALNPIAVELEGFLPDQQSRTARCLSTALLRTMLMAVIVSLAFALPYFDTMLSFVGSALSMTMCVVFPCAFYVKIFGTQISKWESVLNYAMVLVALFMGITGSVDSIKKLILHNNPIQVDNSDIGFDFRYKKSMVIDLNEQLLAEFDNNNTKQNSPPIHEGTSSFFQATFNNVGVLVGLGMLSCPYALEQGGWLGLVFLITCGIICCYTAHLIGLCLASKPGISTYQQIAECAFGWTGRLLVTVLVYMELFGTLTGFTISLKDNLVKIFPHASVNFAWIHIPPTQLLPTVAVLLVLPVICMRDLKWVSYVSLGGIAAYFMIVLSVLWAGVADGVGFHQTVPLLRPSKLSEVLGLYAFCYAGHLVVPRIYSSMKNPSQYPKVATVTFSIATLIYITVATAGATMFGESIRSQVTLNLPTYLPVSKVALWVVILIPLTKYALNVNPIAVELEALALALRPSQPYIIQLISSTIIRTLLMVFVLTLALSVPAFETTLALVGSAISVSTCIVLPCLFYAQIFRESISASKLALSLLLAALGVGLATIGTLAAVRKLW